MFFSNFSHEKIIAYLIKILERKNLEKFCIAFLPKFEVSKKKYIRMGLMDSNDYIMGKNNRIIKEIVKIVMKIENSKVNFHPRSSLIVKIYFFYIVFEYELSI